jgi:hypothetical protein
VIESSEDEEEAGYDEEGASTSSGSVHKKPRSDYEVLSPEKIKERNALILEMYEENPKMTNLEIAQAVMNLGDFEKFSEDTVTRVLIANGKSKRLSPEKRKQSNDLFLEMHDNQPEMTYTEIAQAVTDRQDFGHVSKKRVASLLAKNGKYKRLPPEKIKQRNDLILEMHDKHPEMTQVAIAQAIADREDFGTVSESLVFIVLKQNGKNKRLSPEKMKQRNDLILKMNDKHPGMTRVEIAQKVTDLKVFGTVTVPMVKWALKEKDLLSI